MKILPNLYPLRFLLAAFVVIFHIPTISSTIGLPFYDKLPLFHKGELAVFYFFSLSGFLILRLIYLEIQSTGKLDILGFYLQRIRRIYPVYYLVFIFGILLYHLVLPMMNIRFDINYPLGQLIAGYIFLMPNVFKYYYPDIGGVLVILWSIGVEEQFYLFIPIILSKSKKYAFNSVGCLLLLLVILLAVFPSFYKYYNYYFYFLSGGFVSILYLKYQVSIFKNETFHYLVYVLTVLSFTTSYFEFTNNFYFHFFNMVLSSCLLSLLSDYPIFVIKSKWINYLGKISYGIYMYHMIVITGLLFVLSKWQLFLSIGNTLYILLLNCSVIAVTVFVSHISHKYFETLFYKSKTVS